MAFDLRSSELEHNFIKERINGIGKHFAEISSKLSSYVKVLACLRDNGNEIVQSISNFASKETYNVTMRSSLGEFSDVLCAIQEYRDAQAHRTQVKVVNELQNYSPLCKQTKIDIKKCFDARVRELKKKSELEKARSKTTPNWQRINQAEKEVNQAQEDAMRMTQEMNRLVERFEKKKLEDLKHAFLEFIKIEMIFHAKAVELYSKAYNMLQEINVEEDLIEFTSHFKAQSSSLNADSQSPSRHVTTPKKIESDTEITLPHLQNKLPVYKGIRETPHLLNKFEESKGIQESPRLPNKLKVFKDIQEDPHSSFILQAQMNADAQSPSEHAMARKNIESDIEITPPHVLSKLKVSKGIQGPPRSIYTLKTAMNHVVNSGSTSGSFVDPIGLS